MTTQPAPDMAAASTLRGTREAHRPPGLLPGPAEASVVAGEEARRCGNEEYEVRPRRPQAYQRARAMGISLCNSVVYVRRADGAVCVVK